MLKSGASILGLPPELGVEGDWMKTHRTPRRALFTPHRVAGGPGKDIKLEKSRVTVGTFVGSGEKFRIEDRYA